jgi:hypothetical protein
VTTRRSGASSSPTSKTVAVRGDAGHLRPARRSGRCPLAVLCRGLAPTLPGPPRPPGPPSTMTTKCAPMRRARQFGSPCRPGVASQYG